MTITAEGIKIGSNNDSNSNDDNDDALSKTRNLPNGYVTTAVELNTDYTLCSQVGK